MPHQTHQRKFQRTTDQRLKMFRNLTLSVLRYERIKTTEAKAKEIRRFVAHMIDLGKDGTLASRRRALAWLPEPEIVEKVFTDLAKRYPDRNSGYVRITRVGHRVGDAAPVVHIELMPGVDEEKKARDAAEAEAKPRSRLPFRRARKTTEAKAETAEKPPARKRTAKKETVST